MEKSKKIQTTVDELACFVASTIANTYSIIGKELTGFQINEIYKRLINDITDIDLKVTKKEFMELLYIYELADQSENEDQAKFMDEIEKIFKKKDPPARNE